MDTPLHGTDIKTNWVNVYLYSPDKPKIRKKSYGGLKFWTVSHPLHRDCPHTSFGAALECVQSRYVKFMGKYYYGGM